MKCVKNPCDPACKCSTYLFFEKGKLESGWHPSIRGPQISLKIRIGEDVCLLANARVGNDVRFILNRLPHFPTSRRRLFQHITGGILKAQIGRRLFFPESTRLKMSSSKGKREAPFSFFWGGGRGDLASKLDKSLFPPVPLQNNTTEVTK